MATENIDTVTVLQAVGATKFYGKKFVDGKAYKPKEHIPGEQSGERPYWHKVLQVKIEGLEGFSKLHARFRTHKRICIIRNKPLNPEESGTQTRVNQGGHQYLRQKRNFTDHGRYWVMFDFDNAVVATDWKQNPEKAVRECVAKYLPEEFHKRNFFWCYSASQGITKGHDKDVNAHVVFWMDRRVTNLEWRAWIEQHDLGGTLGDCVDESLFRDTQPHYITDPILVNTPDPFKKLARSGLYEGRESIVKFDLDPTFVTPPETRNAATYQSDNIFDIVKRYEKSEEAKAFNKFIKIHEVLQQFGFIVKIGQPHGKPIDEKYQCRYLDPDSESGVAGVGVTVDGELHSFHSNGLFRDDKFYDSYETYCLLAENERRQAMLALGMEFDDIDEEFTEEQQSAEVDPEEALSAIDTERAFENADSPALIARVLAHKLTIMGALRWINKHYFLLTLDSENIFNSYSTLDPSRGKEMYFHRKGKVQDLIGAFKFQNSYIERDENNDQVLVSRPVNIIRTYLRWPGKRHYDDVGLYFGKGGPNRLDLWEGFAVDPLEGDWTTIAYHLHEVLCGGDYYKYTYLLDLLASWFQNPAEKFGVAIVLIGGKGTGKNAFFDFLATLLSPAQVLIDSNPDTFFGPFNSMLMGKVLVGLDEVGFGGNKSMGQKIKTLVTSPTVVVNRKNLAAITTNNHSHLVFMSNDKWPVETSRDERRFFVLRMSDIHQQDTSYFDRLFKAIRSRRVQAAFLDAMLKRKITQNVREVVRTQTMREMAVLSESVVTRWLLQQLEFGPMYHMRGEALDFLVDVKELATEEFFKRQWGDRTHPDWGDWIPVELAQQDFVRYCDQEKINYRQSLGILSHELSEVFGRKTRRVWAKPEELLQQTDTERGLKKRGYDWPSEEELEKVLGQVAPEKKALDQIYKEALEDFKREGLVLVPGKEE